ncbi:hypothetical protein [Halomonas sp. DQ26W]|nr:hypothetical protein [Halomonas sp. DQ26W]
MSRASCEMTERCFDETLVIERYWQVLQRRAPAVLQVRGGDDV